MFQHLAITVTICLSYVALAFRGGLSNGQDAVKTILTEDGDLFNCIDINQQPTLRHPLLKNHKIQMSPSSYPFELRNQSLPGATKLLAQLPTISCPRGTIPVLQNKGDIVNFQSFRTMDDKGEGEGELAVAKTVDNFYGSRVSINVYEPKVKEKSKDYSASWFILLTDEGFFGAGSMVWPSFSGDSFARFHITWQHSKSSDQCFDHSCPGFVQVSSSIGLGSRIQPVSVYNGPQHQIDVLVFKDPKTKDWWLALGGKQIGYWPRSTFAGMPDKVTQGVWGGHVWGPTAKSYFPQMGSGHFASEGFGKAAFVKDIKIVDENNKYVTPNMDKSFASGSKLDCYPVDNLGHDEGGMHVFYGGPGGCKA